MVTLLFFFILAYALSWSAFVPLALEAQGVLAGVPAWLQLGGSYGPLIAALIMTAVSRGKSGLRDLIRRMTRWRIGWFWMAVSLLSPGVVFLLINLVLGILTGDWSGWGLFGKVGELPGVQGVLGWLVWIMTFGLGEETGWRGFALPRLQKRYSARQASLLLGLVWAGWHIPVFFYNYELSFISVITFLVGILSGSALLTWLYNSTEGSVLAVIWWHGSYNAVVAETGGIISGTVTAFVILAVFFIANRYGPETFSHREKHTL